MHRTHAAAVKFLTNALVRPASGAVPQAERSNRNQRSNCNQPGVQVSRQPDLRKLDRLLGLQYASLEETPPKEQVLAAAVSEKVFKRSFQNVRRASSDARTRTRGHKTGHAGFEHGDTYHYPPT